VFAAALAALAGTAAASADPVQVGEGQEVEVTAEVEGLKGLFLTVEAGEASLEEDSANPAVEREFKGKLPKVTVTDTRDVDDIADGAYWSVVGQATDFTGDGTQPVIPKAQFGWTPAMFPGSDDGDGTISEGPEVGTSRDGDDGMDGSELLYWAPGGSRDLRDLDESVWSATADLVLKTDPGVEAGTYTSTLTLSLFE
jgi:hypothetical protein